MNKTAASTLADNIVAQFKYEFTANEVNDVAIPEDSISKEAALRTMSREIADGFIREKALNELKERDERSYRRFAKYVRYPECPVVPDNFKIAAENDSGNFGVRKCVIAYFFNVRKAAIFQGGIYKRARGNNRYVFKIFGFFKRITVRERAFVDNRAVF